MVDPRVFIPADQNQMCSHCSLRPAIMFCNCLGRKTPLCTEDMPRHYEKNPTTLHSILPIHALASASAPEYYEKMQQRSTRFAQGKEVILENLTLIDKCIQEYTTIIDQLMTYLANYRDYVLAQLQSEKTTLETEIWEAINEVESSLSSEFPELQKPLSIALQGGDLGQLRLFQYSVDVGSIGNMIQNILKYAFSERSEVRLIAVQEKGVKFFDLVKEQWQLLFSLQEKIMVDFASAFTLIGGNKVLVCGGGLSQGECCTDHLGNHAYILERQSANQHSVMLVPRSAHGILYDSSRLALYVFGGGSVNHSDIYLEPLRSCETFLTLPLRWEILPDMQEGRYSFNPVMHSSLVYLCGGLSSTIEIYDPEKKSFAFLAGFVLPKQSHLSSNTAVIDSENLIVISRYTLTKWSLQQRQILFSKEHSEHDKDQSKYSCPWSNSLPVVHNGVCYIVDLFKQACRGICLASGDVIKEVSLE